MCDPHTRKPRGFGFVTYDTTQAVDRACMTKFHELNGTRHKPSAPRPLPPSSTFPLVLLSRPSFFPTLSGKRVEVKRAIPQDRMAAEDGGMGGMKPNDPNVLAALAGGLFPGGMQGLGGGGQPGGPNGANGYPASLLQGLQGGNGQGGGNGAGGWPGQTPDTTQQGLDAAISAANSVLGSMTEPPQQDTTKSQVPSGILNAFNNPTGNFSTASAALSNGARTGYNGNNNEQSQQGPPSGGNGGGGGNGADVSTGAQAEAQAQAMINIQAQQLASQQQQQQQQFQSTLLQFQQQQLLLQQMQQRQRQQQQLQQLEQLQKLQQALLTTGPAQTAAATATMPTMEPLPGGANGATPTTPTEGQSTAEQAAALEQQIRLLSMEAQANGVGNAPAAAADGANTAPNGEASPAGQPTSPNSTTLPGFEPSNNGSAPVMEGQPYLS